MKTFDSGSPKLQYEEGREITVQNGAIADRDVVRGKHNEVHLMGSERSGSGTLVARRSDPICADKGSLVVSVQELHGVAAAHAIEEDEARQKPSRRCGSSAGDSGPSQREQVHRRLRRPR